MIRFIRRLFGHFDAERVAQEKADIERRERLMRREVQRLQAVSQARRGTA